MGDWKTAQVAHVEKMRRDEEYVDVVQAAAVMTPAEAAHVALVVGVVVLADADAVAVFVALTERATQDVAAKVSAHSRRTTVAVVAAQYEAGSSLNARADERTNSKSRPYQVTQCRHTKAAC